MNWTMVFIIASIVVDLIVIVGANIWALRDTPARALGQSADQLSTELQELLEAEPRKR